jgi:hypothetical protein
MALNFTSKDADGTPFEWKLERGGNLYARREGTQRWRKLGVQFYDIEKAKVFATRNHTEVQ